MLSFRCGLHEQAQYRLDTGNIVALKEDRPIYDWLNTWKWKQCQCGLYAKIVEATK